MNKYGNHKTRVDGMTFDSIREGRYYIYLRDLLRKGEISNLRMQVPFEVVPAVYTEEVVHLKRKDKTVRKCVQKAVHYIADFVYTDTASGKEVVIDAKGYKTKEYILKKKMMLAFKGIEIVET